MTHPLVRPALAALAVLFLATHVPFLPESLEDIDSVNFALGVRDFDVALHQPHPPGYPVYIALVKALVPLFGGSGEPAAVLTALAAWSVIAGTLLVPLAFVLFRGMGSDERRALCAAVLVSACPLFWFTALRPLSDMAGLAVAIAAQALTLAAFTGVPGVAGDRALVIAGALAGIAAGIRVQTVMLTAPLLAVSLVAVRHVSVRTRVLAVLAAAAACVLWTIPLLAANGGVGGYLAALGTQAGEDFTGVVMLWTTRTPRVAAAALSNSLLWPWGSVVAGAIVMALAAAGAVRLAARQPRALMLVALAFAPYAAFHLLFHETATIRYALPLVLPIAWLAATAIDMAGRRAGIAITAILAAVLLSGGIQAARGYGSHPAPAFQAVRAAASDASLPLATHTVFRRTVDWEVLQAGGNARQGRLVGYRAPHGREWLTLVEQWRREPAGSIAVVADPSRTDLWLFDPHARELRGTYRWALPDRPYVGGVRPGAADWYLMRPPGWMLDRGWALSAEIGGVTAKDVGGPHVQPSVAWIRGRSEDALMLVGGRNLGGGGTASLRATHDGRTLDSWEAAPGFFLRRLSIPAGTFPGSGYTPLAVSASSTGSAARVALEQFDLQPEGVPMVAYADGWHEPEYNPALATAWRWASERSVLWVRPIGRDVTLTLAGESPLRYFDGAPNVRVTAAGQEISRFAPAADFSWEARLPARLLEQGGGDVVIESDRWFTPASAGAADQRHLALRVYRVSVR